MCVLKSVVDFPSQGTSWSTLANFPNIGLLERLGHRGSRRLARDLGQLARNSASGLEPGFVLPPGKEMRVMG